MKNNEPEADLLLDYKCLCGNPSDRINSMVANIQKIADILQKDDTLLINRLQYRRLASAFFDIFRTMSEKERVNTEENAILEKKGLL